MFHHVKVYHEEGNVIPTHVIVDGEPIRCKRVVFNQGVDELPEVMLLLNSLVDIDSPDTKVTLGFVPAFLEDAAKMVRHELLLREDFYNGFLSSIESSLRENLDRTDIHKIAVDVLDRIMGDEECKC